MHKSLNIYRLRKGNRIVGYAEQTPKGLLFKGKEALWWMRGYPNYDCIDEAVGLMDKLNRSIFEMDIISYKLNDKKLRKGVVLWRSDQECFGIFDLESKHFTNFFIEDICLFSTDKPEIISHLFNQPKLKTALGLDKLD